MFRRKLLEDGTLGPLEPVFEGELLPEQQIELLGMQLAFEKLSAMQANAEKDGLIDSMGAQLVQMRIELMQLKGSGI